LSHARLAALTAVVLLSCSSRPPSVATEVDVTGTVVDLEGAPLAGVKVRVGDGAVVTTGADGSFHAGAVPVPFDVAAVATGAGGATAVVYQGLFRPDPLLYLDAQGGTLPAPATVSGTVAGNGIAFPLATNTLVEVSLQCADVSEKTALTSGSWSISSTWAGPSSQTGVARALWWQRDPATSLPSAYLGYGERPISLGSSQTLGGVAIALGPVGSAILSGALRAAPGHTLTARGMDLLFGSTDIRLLGTERTLPIAPSFSYPVPTGLPMVGYGIFATSTVDEGSVLEMTPAALTGFDHTMRSAPVPLEPAAGATGVSRSTRFAWAGFPGGIYRLQAAPAAGNGPTYRVFTASTEAHLPDLSALGAPLPAGASYSWRVDAYAPCASVDAAVTRGAGCPTVAREYDYVEGVALAVGGPRTITLSP